MFQLLFERSADAIWLFDPQAGIFVDCNAAAVELMGAGTKERLLGSRPEDLSPPLQPDGTPSREKSAQIVALVEQHGGHRFEWVGRRLDGREVPLEVLSTPIEMRGRNLTVVVSRDITERKGTEAALRESEQRFRGLFEASSDGILILDQESRSIIDCNAAALRMKGGGDREWLLSQSIESLSAERQPDGRASSEAARAWIERALADGPQRFEWMATRYGGEPFPVEILLTPLRLGGRRLLVAASRDISERKKTERELMELNQSLERRVAERTAALTTSEARFRALVEHAPEAIVVFDGATGRFLFGNEHACALYRVPMEKLTELTPADVSPEFQPSGRRSSELARELMDQALAGGTPVFEWTHRQPEGRLIPTEVRLLRLPAEGQNLVRASIIDNTERKRAEQSLHEANRDLRREIEQRTRAEELLNERIRTSTLTTEVALALNAGTELQAMLQQCTELVVRNLDVAFTRIWTLNEATQTLELQASAGCYTHLNGTHSRVRVGQYKIGLIAQEKKPHLTNCVQTDARVSDKAWAAREGMVAFAGYPLLLEDRVLGVLALFARRPLAEDVLKALGSVADSISLGIERKRAQTALAESEARFSVAFQASPIFFAIARMSDGRFVLVNDAFVTWSGHRREEILGRNTAELTVWERQEEREAYWAELRRTGSIRARECRFRNRTGGLFIMLLSSEVIQVNRVPHMLTLALDITERKQTEAELRASEARLRESEARFSAAFQASPVFITILSMSEGRYVLANDAFVNWLGCPREKVIGRISTEFGLWENPEERDSALNDMRTVGSIRQREVRWRNRSDERLDILLSAETIKLNDTPHILSFAQDITQRKRAEGELLKTLEREKELSQLKSNFVSMVSHEFRTPLGIIQSSAELLRNFYQRMSTDERDEQLDSITRNTRRMAGMMEEILVLSCLDAGKLDFQPTALDLNVFCRRVLDEVLSATNRRCPIELVLGPASTQAQADERLLAHIFTNLLSNAVKYSEPGTAVRFTVEQDGSDAVCTVRDEGIGISEKDQQHLFKAFHRGSNVGARPGTGLGLLLVKRCAELHGGKVHLNSRVGEGTTVTVRLPVFEGIHEKNISY
jgi:PAS domain S-box-containing protein